MKGEIPQRADVPSKDRWDLASLFPTEEAWEEALKRLASLQQGISDIEEAFGPDKGILLGTLSAFSEYSLLDERLGYYAHLRLAEDGGDSSARGRNARYLSCSTAGQAAWAWLTPAMQALPEGFAETCASSPEFADYKVFIEKLLRFKPHVLSKSEEGILARQAEVNQTAQECFGVLTNVDFDFGRIGTESGQRALSQSTFASFMRNKDRSLRRKAYLRFYREYDKHKHTLASLYSGSVKLDIYQAKVRKYPSARAMALFPDKVSESVYDNLVSTIRENLPVLHEYYELRKRALGLDELRHYDVYVPFVEASDTRYSYEEAVRITCAALAPLGEEYVETLRRGLEGGWVDRYENKGKRSGAFSAGSFSGNPYILLNYKEDVLRDLFTMAHEGGHSMHSWYSARSNPFLSYSYTIFEAEVASTFNEHLVFSYLYERAKSPREKASLLSSRIDDSLATLFRQTMFAEFEARVHAMAEAGEALTLEALRATYAELLRDYFGPELVFERVSDLEGLRIPHFYNAFYVYKYATGLAASKALAAGVLGGGEREREAYFAFLRSGGSRFPMESLRLAGVDMEKPEPLRLA
ncbi:MAG TPA: oligoendopeptidase F, partial [Rectinemataceae bacterium]